MNLRAIIASVPLLRRVWRFLPGPLRVPVLIVAAVVGVWYLISGRKDETEGGETV